jgi:hypothetical protein
MQVRRKEREQESNCEDAMPTLTQKYLQTFTMAGLEVEN